MGTVFKVFFFTAAINYLFFAFFSDQIFKEDFQITNFKINIAPDLIKPGAVLFLGDSPAINLSDPKKLNFNSYNLAIPCSSLFEYYAQSKNLNLKILKTRLIVLSMHIKRSTNQENCLMDFSIRGNVFSWGDVFQLFIVPSAVDFSGYRSQFDLFRDIILYKLYLHPNQLKEIHLVNIFQKKFKMKDTFINDYLVQNKGQFYGEAPLEFPINSVSEKYKAPFKLHAFEENLLEKLLLYLKQENIHLVLINPIYSRAYQSVLSHEFLESYHKYFKNLQMQHSNFHYEDKIFYFDNNNFLDSVHPNQEGVLAYSQWLNVLIPQLEKRIYKR